MNQVLSFAEYIKQHNIDAQTIEEAVQYYVAQATNYTTPEELLDQLKAESTDPTELQRSLEQLARHPNELNGAAMEVLSAAWDEPSGAETVTSLIEQARGTLIVPEPIILATIIIYGMYLLTTGGVQEEKEEIREDASGKREYIYTRKYFGPAGPLSAIMGLLPKLGGRSNGGTSGSDKGADR